MAGGPLPLTNRVAAVVESELVPRFLVLMEEDDTPGESLIGL